MLQVCLISSRSSSQKLKVGAVIVKDRRVIRSGYNVYPSGCDHIRIHRHYHEVNTRRTATSCLQLVALEHYS